MSMSQSNDRHLADYLAFMQAEGKALDTCRHYSTYLRQFFHWLDAEGIEKPTAKAGMRFLVELSQRKNYRTQAYNQAYYSVRGYLRWLWDDPTLELGIKPRPEKARARQYLALSDAKRLLGAVSDSRYRCFLELLFATGLRLSEGLHLRVQDIERGTDMLLVRGGKGGHDRRVPLAASMRDRLRVHWRRWRPTDYLFPSTLNAAHDHVNKGTIQVAFRRASQATGIGVGQNTHVLRHSFAYLQLVNGLDIRDLQRILGHVDIRTTMRYLQDLDLEGRVRPRVIDLLADEEPSSCC